MKGLEYRGVSSIDGPLVFIENISDVAFDELVEITSPDGETRLGQVLDVTATTAVVQVFGGTENLSQRDTKTRFLGESLRIPVSKDMLGRVFDGLARPKDGLPAPLTTERRDVNGMPVNPYAREYPRDFIQTGISSIDLMNTLVRGDKPIMGKPFYLAPELKDGAEESAASDYFSLGVMILRLLTQVWYMPGAQLDDMLMPLDPMWRTILPRLLRDKPAERECVPWRQAKSASPIRLLSGEANTQEIFLRIRFPHWVIGTILFIAACTFVALTILAALERGRYNAAQSEVERLTRIIMELKK
jgi:hypothetical protein